ncbi:MAG TPA: bifunctional nuclease family protein [Candidatus Eisenbacteria bacterium]|jgi:bifunctional DNase/RNase|nr:bifunctional nuclease family protein [Candidatus Eisenbacteria bacterium]
MIKEAKISSIVSLFPLPQYVVVLEDIEKTRLVPIWIGVNEGNAIALEMQGEKFPRPLTHDLMVNLLHTLGAVVEKVVVSDLKENSYYALIHMKHNGKAYEIDARPSDSLALAVRLHCPIYIDERVLKKCPQIDSSITQEEIEKFKEDLKSMSPEEFFKTLEESPAVEGPEPGKPFGDLEEGGEEEDEEEGDDEEDRP